MRRPGCVDNNPSGAMAYVDGKSVGTTPAQVTLDGNKPVSSRSTEGYFPESFTYQPTGISTRSPSGSSRRR